MAARETEVVRETRETRVEVRLRLDGSGDLGNVGDVG